MALNDILATGLVSPIEARSLQGRLQYANRQVFGKLGSAAIAQLGFIAENRCPYGTVTPQLACVLSWLVRILIEAKPREVSVQDLPPVLIFSDGA